MSIQRFLHGVARPFKALGRSVERRMARRLSQRYADEIKQFDELARAMRDLGEQVHARLDKQEGFQWDHVALARRLAQLEDHVEQLLRRQAGSELVPSGAGADRQRPASRAAKTEETKRSELIPFRVPLRCTEQNASGQEAA